MASGIEMLLKSAGINIAQVTAEIEQWKTGVVQTLKAIESHLLQIEKRNEQIWQKLTEQEQSQPNQPQPQLAAQPQPQTPPTIPPVNP